MSRVLVINPILYTSERNQIPQVRSIKDTMIYTLCLGFCEAGHEVTLIAAKDYRPGEEEEYEFPVIWQETVWHRIFQPRCFPYMPKLRQYLKDHKEFDMIISSEVFATWSYTAVRLYPEKTIVWHELARHNRMMWQMPSRFWYRFVAGIWMRKARIVPRSEAAATFISRYLPHVSDSVIDHGVRIDRFGQYLHVEKQNRFAVVSQLIPRKRIERTIESFAEFVHSGHSDYLLYIIGQGEEEKKLKDLSARLGLDEQIIFCGQMTHEQMMPIVAAAKALLVYTQKDNNMVSIVESIALGTPIVTTTVPYNAAYIRREGLGIVEDDWNGKTLEQICAGNLTYVHNCMKYREKLSNVYCANQFFAAADIKSVVC